MAVWTIYLNTSRQIIFEPISTETKTVLNRMKGRQRTKITAGHAFIFRLIVPLLSISTAAMLVSVMMMVVVMAFFWFGIGTHHHFGGIPIPIMRFQTGPEWTRRRVLVQGVFPIIKKETFRVSLVGGRSTRSFVRVRVDRTIGGRFAIPIRTTCMSCFWVWLWCWCGWRSTRSSSGRCFRQIVPSAPIKQISAKRARGAGGIWLCTGRAGVTRRGGVMKSVCGRTLTP